MKKHILCFGDSNTHGYCADPSDCEDGGIRFNESERWTMLLQKQLGSDYLIIEEGLSGRTTTFEDPLYEGRCGIDYIAPCLKSHEMIDLLIIMLGTNDTKDRFAASAPCIASCMMRLVKKAMTTECWTNNTPNILVIAPPAIRSGMLTSAVAGTMGSGCVEKSEQLAKEYRIICEMLNIPFLDAAQAGCEFNQIDFMHLTKKGHKTLADVLGTLVPKLV